jgi:hypothetical protein
LSKIPRLWAAIAEATAESSPRHCFSLGKGGGLSLILAINDHDKTSPAAGTGMANRTAIIFGVTGIVGRALASQLRADGDCDVIGVFPASAPMIYPGSNTSRAICWMQL